MSFTQELSSWFAPSTAGLTLASPPEIGSNAPSEGDLNFPREDGKPVVVAFLRHCGCPFAEATFLNLRRAAASHPEIHFVAVSHSTKDSTAKWVDEVGGVTEPDGRYSVSVIVDPDRKIYSAWGLGTSSFLHVLSPAGLYAVYALGKERGIWNRPTESGSRWQTSGAWAADGKGVVRWGGVAGRADEVPDVEDAVKALSAV